jgi:protease-4
MMVGVARNLIRLVANALRRLRRPPDHVLFVLAGELPSLSERRRGLLRWFLPKKDSLREIVERMDAVARDPRVRGVVLHLHALRLSVAGQQSVRAAIVRLQATGKTVTAWATVYDTVRYHIACACDHVVLQPGGRVEALGVAQRYLFLADALQRVGLAADFLQISPYKTAPDMLTRRAMSDEAREMATWLAEDVYGQLVDAVSAGRSMDRGAARDAIDGAPYIDQDARDAALVDELLNEEALPALLSTGRRPARIAPYHQIRRALLQPRRPLSSRAVGLLRISGDIIDGRSSRPPVKPPFRLPLLFSERAGDLSVVEAARRASRSRRLAAVVVHIDSGGGSATSSEAMASAIARLAERKPVVVSMGAVAASGGYYVATPAQYVFAQPGTITGSIGVLAGKLVSAALLARLGIHDEWVERGGGLSLQRGDDAYTEAERETVWRSIERAYRLFLERVAVGRGLSADAVDAIGGGRVWTGRQALERGLVDEFGGLEEALAKARKLGGLHPDAPARAVRARGSDVAPIPSRAVDLLSYAAQGLGMLQGEAPLCLCPLSDAFD